MKEPIPSPFTSGESDFLREVAALIKKHGYSDYFIAFSEPASNNDESTWSGHSNVLNEGLLEYFEALIEFGREKLDEQE